MQQVPTTSSSNPGMIVAIIVIILLVIAASIAGFIFWRKFTSKTGTIDTENAKAQSQDGPKQVPNASVVSMNPSRIENDTFEEQYHPKAEFGNIFSRGDPFKKANDADHVIDEDDDEEGFDGSVAQVHLPTDHEVFYTNSPEGHMQDDTPMSHSHQVVIEGKPVNNFSGLNSPRNKRGGLKLSTRQKSENLNE